MSSGGFGKTEATGGRVSDIPVVSCSFFIGWVGFVGSSLFSME